MIFKKMLVSLILILASEVVNAECSTTPLTNLNVADIITTVDDLSTNSLPAKFHFTNDLNIARQLALCNQMPALWLGDMLFDKSTGLLLPDAWNNIINAASNYPEVFARQGMLIEIVDEPFWKKSAPQVEQISAIKQAVAMVRAYAPKASLGTVVAPVWDTEPSMIEGALAIIGELDWIATDPYAMELTPAGIQRTLQLANDFGTYVKFNYPKLQSYLIVQGFSPINEVVTSQYTESQFMIFEQFLTHLGEIAIANYSGVAIWGWSNTNELPPQYAGKYFPEKLKLFYMAKFL